MAIETVVGQAVESKPKRLAITIAGAVSLGSYEAGVMWEVLDAIAQHNKQAVGEEQKIFVDVVTGASAGGMTAVILANKLLYAGSDFQGPYDNPLYDIWVNQINLQDLQKPQTDENSLHSLLSSNLIERISRSVLTNRYEAGVTRELDLHGAVQLPKEKEAGLMKVGVALTNLDGVDYGVPVYGAPSGSHPSDQFIYREYADQRTRTICRSSDKLAFWEPLRRVAVACGAFPIAFRAQDVVRSAKHETDDYPPEHLWPWSKDRRVFTYSDGGILQNQPIGIAKNLVDEFDNHQDQDSRFYLFVSPHAKEAGDEDSFHEADANYFHLLRQLVKVVIGQAQFRDWITAEGVNQRVQLMDQRAAGLAKGILKGVVAVRPLQTTADAVLQLMFPAQGLVAPGSTRSEQSSEAVARIQRQYASEVLQLATNKGAGAVSAFCASMAAFEAAAGLGARDMMKIYGITAMDSELAGAGVESFLGFFDREFRDHDYDVGRKHAQEFLRNLNGAHAGVDRGDCTLGPINFNPQLYPVPDPPRPTVPNPALAGMTFARLKANYPGDYERFRSGLKSRVSAMVDESMKKNPVERFLFSGPIKLGVKALVGLVLNRL